MVSEPELNPTGDPRDCPSSSPPHKTLYSLGHSNLEFTRFARLLKDHVTELLVDVRSLPRSSRFPQFSQPGFDNPMKVGILARDRHYFILTG